MSYKIIIVFFALMSFVFLGADSPPVIELKPGLNEVTIRVLNKCNSDFESIHVVINQQDLPEGLTISQESQHIKVTAKSQSEAGLMLRMKVAEHARPGIYEIPLVLKDKTNHSWKYTLTAKLEINKPDKYDLLQNYPNPFNSNTQIEYALVNDQEQETQLVIYDLLGKQVRMLVNKKQSAGNYRVIWDGKDEQGTEVANGIYFDKITSGSFAKIRKMTLLK